MIRDTNSPTTYIYGAGGHGKVVCDILLASKTRVSGFIDGNPKSSQHFGFPVVRESDIDPNNSFNLVVAIGANHVRQNVMSRLRHSFPNMNFVSAIHPSAVIANGVRIGLGTVVAANAFIGVDAKVGEGCVINTGAQADHDCDLSDYVSLAPGAILGGNVRVDEGSYLALGCRVLHSVEIGAHVVIGAGAVVTSKIRDCVVAYGAPCKVVRSRSPDDSYL